MFVIWERSQIWVGKVARILKSSSLFKKKENKDKKREESLKENSMKYPGYHQHSLFIWKNLNNLLQTANLNGLEWPFKHSNKTVECLQSFQNKI